jgi:predicted DsbA family dithiol-disulfide isomerase
MDSKPEIDKPRVAKRSRLVSAVSKKYRSKVVQATNFFTIYQEPIMTKMHIDIVSDIACPWCAIGYARLERAMEQLAPDYEFTIEWHAFELNPDHNGPGEPILPALARKYGRSEDEMRSNQNQMMAIAKDLGVNFGKLQERFTCNTFDAHRLVKWAGTQGLQTEMKQALFEAYFGRAEDVSDQNVLVRCARALGLESEQAREILNSGQYAQTVREDEATYQQAGISSVPAFIINSKYLVSGAQEPETLVQTFREIATESVEGL